MTDADLSKILDMEPSMFSHYRSRSKKLTGLARGTLLIAEFLHNELLDRLTGKETKDMYNTLQLYVRNKACS